MGQRQSFWEKEYNHMAIKIFKDRTEFFLSNYEVSNDVSSIFKMAVVQHKNIATITELNCNNKLEIIFEEDIPVDYCKQLHKLLLNCKPKSLYITILVLNSAMECFLAYLNMNILERIVVWNNVDNNENYYEMLKVLSVKTNAGLLYTSRIDNRTEKTQAFFPQDEIED